jgi:UDP-N-acetylglucosamine--N-acetylmuramyl-(pentapeptide) pyrophosphoryl-undecaprenol N-acetylglucosamine transferase
MKEMIKKCDKIIIPENGNNEKNIIRTGPIVRSTTKNREELRKKFGFIKKTITLSVGGTDAGKFLIKQTIEALKNNNEAELVIVSGPNLQENFEKNIKSLGFVTNLHEIIYASDVVISLAGKSTIDESITYGTPGIFIPIKDHFEQEDNAKELGYSFDDIFRLEELIREKLKENRNPIKTHGATNASSAIEHILSTNSQ